jgi:hypothetical protein
VYLLRTLRNAPKKGHNLCSLFHLRILLTDYRIITTRSANLIQVITVALWIESEYFSIIFPFLLHFLTMATCCWLQIETNDLPQSERKRSKWVLHTSALQSASREINQYTIRIRRFGGYSSLNSKSRGGQKHILSCKYHMHRPYASQIMSVFLARCLIQIISRATARTYVRELPRASLGTLLPTSQCVSGRSCDKPSRHRFTWFSSVS